MAFHPVLALAPFALLLGCSAPVTDVNHHNGAGTGVPPSTTTSYAVAIGKTTGAVGGTQTGYSVIALGPKQWRFKWTGDANTASGAAYREFYGSVWTTGTFTAIFPGCQNSACPLEPGEGDFVSAVRSVAGGQEIDWDTIASGGFDGFDVNTDTEPVLFDAYVDGSHVAAIVYFPSANNGGAVASPAALPAGFTSQ
jgi:hypothetical protein